MTITTPRLSSSRVAVGLVATGLLLGLVSKWADQQGPDWLAGTTTGRGPWIALAFAVGWLAPTSTSAAVRAVLLFVPVVAGYTGYATWVLHHPLGTRDVAWLLIALIACPAIAVLVRRATTHPIGHPLVAGATAALILTNGPAHRLLLAASGQLADGPTSHMSGLLDLALAAAVLLTPRRVPWVALALLTAAVLTPLLGGVLDVLQTRLHLG